MTKFETANELISFVKEKDLKRGFYQKGKRIQWLVDLICWDLCKLQLQHRSESHGAVLIAV